MGRGCGLEAVIEYIFGGTMKFGVVQFPGSNCDDDAYHAIGAVVGKPVEFIWHQSAEVSGFDAILLPGGFSYGDYLRTGAIARFSPVMPAIKQFARGGGLVLGVCNGFQILLEAGLLPGAMLRNRRLRFLCRPVHVRVENAQTPFTCAAHVGQVLEMPIAHMEGNYFCDAATLEELERNKQVVFRYVHADGRDAGPDDFDANPNGALAGIAGICNRERNVAGLMPHPERAVESALGSADGLVILRSMVESLTRRAAERVSA
jgi:phosphoribosylformylglycinamidine synthase subunit PurQ / glutaminase